MTEDIKSLQYLPQELCTNLFRCVLEEVLNQLFILERISNCPKMNSMNKNSNKTINLEKNMETTDNLVTDRIKRNQATFVKNFDAIVRTLKTVYEELGSNGTYESLVEVVEELRKSKTEGENLKQETVKKQDDLKKLEYTLYKEEKLYHKKIEECMADIGKIKDEIEDFLVESEIKLEYIQNWQYSKIEMCQIFLERKEQEKMTELKTLDADVYREARVHQEVLTAYNEMQKDTQCAIDNWKEKYYKDYKELEVKIQVLKDKRKKQSEAIRLLKETYFKRQKEIDNYKLYKMKEQEKKLELEKRHEAATKIQAWWRGTMVRKGFGKFRKKKDKKEKKKK